MDRRSLWFVEMMCRCGVDLPRKDNILSPDAVLLRLRPFRTVWAGSWPHQGRIMAHQVVSNLVCHDDQRQIFLPHRPCATKSDTSRLPAELFLSDAYTLEIRVD